MPQNIYLILNDTQSQLNYADYCFLLSQESLQTYNMNLTFHTEHNETSKQTETEPQMLSTLVIKIKRRRRKKKRRKEGREREGGGQD